MIITCIHLTLRLLHLREAISKNLYNKEKTSEATATSFCVLQNKLEANRPQSVTSTQSHHVSKNTADSLVRWYNMYESHQVTVHFAIFLMCKHLFWSFGKVGFWGSTVCDRVMPVPVFPPPTGVQHSSWSLPSFQFVTCFQDLVVKVLRLVGIHIVSGSTDCLQEGKRMRREAAN